MTLIVNDKDRDVLADPEVLDEFLDEQSITGSRAGDEKELTAMRRLRRRLRAVFALAAEDDRDGVIAAVNALIADSRAIPRLVEHDGLAPHLHYTPPDAPLDQRFAAEVGVALAILVRDHGLDRLRICAAPDCENVLVDLSKNRSRRFCSTQCANRQHVAAYRRRQAEAGSEESRVLRAR